MNVLTMLVIVLQINRIRCANTGSLLQISRKLDGSKKKVVQIDNFYNILKNQPNRQIDHSLKFRDTVSYTRSLEIYMLKSCTVC